MASHFFNEAKRAFAAKEIDFGSDTFVALLCGTDTTADVDYDANTVSGITALDEHDGAGFTWGHGGTGRKTLSVTVSETPGGAGVGYAMVDAVDLLWPNLLPGSRLIQGILVLKSVTNDTDNIPICWTEFPAPYGPSGVDLPIAWDSSGLIKFE